MKKQNNGGPAFPYGQENHTERSSEGMTLRDYFAAKAMAGMLSEGRSSNAKDWMPEEAYKIADAMLAARKEVTK